MSDEQLTDRLSTVVMGWQVTRDRIIKRGGSWKPKWRFTPLTRLQDAFELLECAGAAYTLSRTEGKFKAEVHINGMTGAAFGEPARAITSALARALGIDVAGDL